VDTDLELILAHAAERPDDVQARIAAAYALERTGRDAEAIAHYDAAWKLGVPESRRRRFIVAYGSSLHGAGRLEESIALLGDATAADPLYPAFKAFLALALYSSGERAAAMATLLDALLDVSGGAALDGYEGALAEAQRVLLDKAMAGTR
jgi:tetratricopeptide (TPR) repeat protein